MTLKQVAIEILKDSTKPMSVKEIWSFAQKKGLLNKIVAKGKSPYSTFSSIVYTDYKRKNNSFIVHESKPKKFSLFKK